MLKPMKKIKGWAVRYSDRLEVFELKNYALNSMTGTFVSSCAPIELLKIEYWVIEP